MRRTIPFLMTTWVLMLICGPALALEEIDDAAETGAAPEEGPGNGETDPALQAFEAGKQLFKEGAFSDAALKFREANRLRPSWKLWFNIGQSEAAAKRNGLALEAFERYVSLGGDEIPPERRDAVTAEINRLQPVVGYVDVTAPEGARVIIDDVERGVVPLPGPLMVASAVNHAVSVVYGSETILEREVMVGGGRTVRVAASAESLSGETGEMPEPPQPETQHRSKLVPVGWALFGTGIATLAAGGGTGIAAVVKSKDLDTLCPGGRCTDSEGRALVDTVDTLAVATDVLLAVGGTVAVTGLVLAIVGKKKSKTAKNGRLNVFPLMGQSQGGLWIEGSF